MAFVKICPRCGGTNITIPPAGLDIKMTVPDYCRDCHNFGLFPEVEESEIDYFQKQMDSHP